MLSGTLRGEKNKAWRKDTGVGDWGKVWENLRKGTVEERKVVLRNVVAYDVEFLL